MHGETNDERIERLRRAYAELGEEFDEARARRMMTFDIDSAPDGEPQVAPDEAALVEFNRELQRAVDGIDWSQQF